MAGPFLKPNADSALPHDSERAPANRVGLSDEAPPWTLGTGALLRNLAARGLI